MATALEIINAAIRASGLKGRGYTLEAEESADGLEVLNQMIDFWRTKPLLNPALTEQSFTMTVGQADYTWGSGGDLNDTRPLDIYAAWIRDSNNNDFDLVPMTVNEYARIEVKDANERPERYYFQPEDTLARIRFESPFANTDTLFALVLVPLTGFTGLSTEDSVPEEYIEPIKYNLAVRLAPEYGGQAPQDIKDLAKEGLREIKARNQRYRMRQARLDPALRQFGVGSSYAGYTGINRG